MDEGSSEPDLIEQESRLRLPRLPSPGWRPSRGASILAAATLVIGLAAGYAAGHGQGRGTVAAPAKPSPSAGPAGRGVASGTIVAAEPPTEEPGTCSVQVGRDLELGIPVTNQSGQTVLLESVKPVTPVSGLLTVVSWRWNPCGFDNNGLVPEVVVLGPGETTWVTAVVEPRVACPGPAPLQFRLTYSVNGRNGTVTLPGFSDLGAVAYSGCPG